jgi:hypothetical protein
MRSLFLSLSVAMFFAPLAKADLTWEGRYRTNLNYLTNVDLGEGGDKDYILHHLILSPKIILADGFELISTVDIFNDGGHAVPGSQAGQSFGGQSTNTRSVYGSDASVALTDSQLGSIRDANIREFYLVYKHAGGRFKIGRSALHFGLGINLNSGQGLFDHYFDNRDLISYELFMGGLKFQPYLARLTDGFNTQSDDAANEFGLIVDWEKKESNLRLGLMVLNRHVQGSLNNGAQDLATNGAAGYQRYGVFAERANSKDSNMRYAVEIGVNSGKLGQNSVGEVIAYDGLGLAFEMDYFTPVQGLKVGLKTGYASGADGSSNNDFSGFAFDRNYDVGMILFNHPLGNRDLDLFSTTAFGRQGANAGAGFETNRTIDSEAVSNTIYVAPYVSYDLNPKWNITTSVLWAQLDSTSVNSPFFSLPNSGLEVSRDLGLELDFSLLFKPFENLSWETKVGAFFPGKAFEGGSQDYDTKSVFGGVSRLSLSFN